MSQRRTLFTIRESQNFTQELWDRFTAKAADEGHSPVAVLRRLIDTYLTTRPSHDPTTEKDPTGD